ncbi:hypothetical protein Afil01_28260 [Actinorhabdospora filicis]|uniref:D-alanyl-D-alanine carboxypeptidase-like core domain-containing protein n=1 Tax=Actinorhabdospora filicis TaxID=1785913 RepID=A0A9W6W8X8_9ACTN|nr:M15 family metallopeptidase [Actinorhabdospora filicis]GLZ78019.1 hypothetical protein Afil01_28260 [Actinorhabdospora filicis]
MIGTTAARTVTRRIRRTAQTALLDVLSTVAKPLGHRLIRDREGLGLADGAIPHRTTVFDDVPGVTGLDPGLLAALRHAARAAARDGIRFRVNSGRRSRAYQERLIAETVERLGSAEQAARWVTAPERSAHVSGHAIDLGPAEATAWLSRHGAAFGLCQIYANEPWHYELRPEAITKGCPAMYPDPSHDPRNKG